jgi:hypothetical protein
VVRSTFEEWTSHESFDLIVHYGVLEHVRDPLSFLSRQVGMLTPTGTIIMAVPKVEDCLRRGDVSVFAHEHWSYFTRASLRTLVREAGARVLRCTDAGVGGALYCALCPGRQNEDGIHPQEDIGALESRVQQGLERMRRYVRPIRGRGQSLGVYCPNRFLNYAALLRQDLPATRLFDDNPGLSGQFLPPLSQPIETRADLLHRPVEHLLVMSRSYGPQIAASLRGLGDALAGTKTVLIDEVL